MARRHLTLHIYVAQELLLSFVVAFLFFFFIFFVNNMLILAEEILAKNVPLRDVVLLIIYTLPSVVSISFPFAALVGALMAVGRLSSDNEMLAFQASGVSRGRLFVPFLVLGIAFTGISFLMNDYFIPVGNINFGRLYRRIIFSSPELELESFSVKRYQDAVIIPGVVDENGISNILIIDETEKKDKRVIRAETARLAENVEQSGVISLELEDVFSHTPEAKKKEEYEYFHSDAMTYNILLSNLAPALLEPGPREMSSVDVYAAIQAKRSAEQKRIEEHMIGVRRLQFDVAQSYYALIESRQSSGQNEAVVLQDLRRKYDEYEDAAEKRIRDRSIHTYELEFYKKFALPFGCIVFSVFAFPVGLLTRRSGRSVGFGVGLFVSIIYWGMLLAGQTFGFRLSFSPFLSMWLPNFVILGAALLFFFIRRNK